MNEVLKSIYDRRSVRAYSDEPISDEQIDEIIKAGFHAPNGCNTQALIFAVITNKQKMKAYSDLGKALFIEHMKKQMASAAPDAKQFFESTIKNLSNPDFNIFYGAPVLVLVFAGPHAVTPVEDGSAAAENMMLAARSMGLGSCWIGYASPIGYDQNVLKELNVPVDSRLIAPLIFGVPKKKDMVKNVRPSPKITAWIK